MVDGMAAIMVDRVINVDDEPINEKVNEAIDSTNQLTDVAWWILMKQLQLVYVICGLDSPHLKSLVRSRYSK